MRLTCKFPVFIVMLVMILSLVPTTARATGLVSMSTQLSSSGTNLMPVEYALVGDTVWDWAFVTLNGPVAPGRVWFRVKTPGATTWAALGTPIDFTGGPIVSIPYTVTQVGTYYFEAVYYCVTSGQYLRVPCPCLIVCETAWAAEGVGTHRFVDKGNWATYVDYLKGSGTVEYPLFAGQTHYAGTLTAWTEGDNLFLEFRSAHSVPYSPGYIEHWSVVEVHVAVGNAPSDIPHTNSGNPVPGGFEYQWEGTHRDTVLVGPIPVGNLNDAFVIAAHAVMMLAVYDIN